VQKQSLIGIGLVQITRMVWFS